MPKFLQDGIRRLKESTVAKWTKRSLQTRGSTSAQGLNCAPSTTDTIAASPWPSVVDRMPPSECAQLAGLSVSEAQVWALSRINQCRQLVEILVTFHNAIAPIHRSLPPEVLAEIFLQHATADHPRPLVVAHVCRTWRSVALDTPCLWAAVAGSSVGPLSDLRLYMDKDLETQHTNRLEYTTAVLQWSKATPLHLQLNQGMPTGPVSPALGRHASRIVHLSVHITSVDTVVVLYGFIKAYRVSSLEMLSIVPPDPVEFLYNYDPEDFSFHTLEQVEFPVLRVLSGVPLDFLPYLVRPTLLEVRIDKPLFRPPEVSALGNQGERLVAALEKCTRVESLVLNLPLPLRELYKNLSPPGWDPEVDWSTRRKVTLPSLQTLLVCAGPSTCVAFSRLLSAPSALHRIFSLTNALPDSSAQWDELLKNPDVGAQGLTQPLSGSVFTVASTSKILSPCGSHKLRVGPSQTNGVIYIQFAADRRTLLPLLLPLIAAMTAPVPPADLSVSPMHDADDALSQATVLLRAFPSLTALSLNGPWCDALLQALAPPGAPPCCPALRKLTVSFPVASTPGAPGYALWCALAMRADGWEEEGRAALAVHRATIVGALERRSALGMRLDELRWGAEAWSTTAGRFGWETRRVGWCHPDKVGVENGEDLRGLVDGTIAVMDFTYEL